MKTKHAFSWLVALDRNAVVRVMNYPDGALKFKGEKYYIDIDKAQQKGAKFIDEKALAQSMDDLAKTGAPFDGMAKRWKNVQFDLNHMEREVLFEGKVDASAIDNQMMRNLRYGGRGLQIFGIAATTYDVTKAGQKSYRTSSSKPLLAEGIRQVGGWGGAWAGFKTGAWMGGLAGLETGPGALLSALGGGIFMGGVGYYAADKVADKVDKN